MIKGVLICEQDFSVEETCRRMRDTHGGAIGALVSFVGLVRDINHTESDADELNVASLTLEHYPGMTESSIEAILDQAEARWPLLEAQVVHRVGTLAAAEQIVLVVVASSHRDAAFAGAEYIMDYLKTNAVFWKKEQTSGEAHWVQSTGNDHARSEKWRN
jgi:molybdopterin synthase catalytic subunit